MYIDDYKRWLGAELEDPALTDELKKIEGQEGEIKERFAVALKFGTAGLRGILGAGSNRMNIYTVRRATQGLANYIKAQGLGRPGSSPGAAVSWSPFPTTAASIPTCSPGTPPAFWPRTAFTFGFTTR